jgi:hypothetical protein
MIRDLFVPSFRSVFLRVVGLLSLLWFLCQPVAAQKLAPPADAIAAVVKDNASARARLADLQKLADETLARKPDPVSELFIEGHLTSDPKNIRSREALRDMGRLDALAFCAMMTRRDDYAAKGREFVTAWLTTYQPTGNPINETNLEPVIRAYDILRDGFSPEEREAMESRIRLLVDAILRRTDPVNNWGSHRLKIVALGAYALRDPELIADVEKKVRRFLGVNLNSDGSTLDFHERDALHYHVYSLVPLLTLAQTARRHGTDFYAYTTPKGASLPKSVAFLVPYATGEKTHAEFVNSKMGFDRRRSEAGQTTFKTGRLFDPARAFPAIALAAAFDPALSPLARKLSPSPNEEFPNWQFVLNAAAAKSRKASTL